MIFKRIAFFTFLLFLNEFAFSQNVERIVDSLTRVLNPLTDDTAKVNTYTKVLDVAKEDSFKVNAYNILSKRLWLSGYYEKSTYSATQALILGKKINYKKGIANAYNNIGVVNIEQSNYQEALKNYRVAQSLRKEIGDEHAIAYSYINIGNVYIQQGNYPEAIKNYLAALKIGEKINDNGIIPNAYVSVANVYTDQGNYTDALKNYFTALQIWEKSKDGHGMSLCYINIGNVYTKLGNYNEALKNFLAVTTADNLTVSTNYGNIGNVYMRQGKYKEALKSYTTALGLQQQMNYKYGIADSYINLGKIYFNLQNQDKAKDYLDKGLVLARETGSKDEIKDAYNVLSELDSVDGNMNGAYRYYRKYADMKDSITNEESNKQISQLKIQYESDKKDREIETQNFQLNTQTLQNKILQTRIYYGGAIGLFIILLFYLRNQRKKREFENKIVILELSLLKSQLNPHFIFNCLHSIKSYIDTNPQTGTDYLNRFSLLMRGVLEKSEEKETSLGEEMQLMEHYIELEKMRLSDRLDYSITFDPSVNKEETMIPPLITQPVIENAIWHGLVPDDKNRVISIYNSVSGKVLTITVSNNAASPVVTKPASSKRKSFGIKITRERLALLKKTIGTEGSLKLEILPDGTKVTLTIPLKEF